MNLRPFRHILPQLGKRVYLDAAAVVIGDVVLADDVSVWPCAVVRGDVNHIRIGARSNIQDGSVLHVSGRTAAKPEGSPPRKQLESGFLYTGSPAKVARELTAQERAFLVQSAANYTTTAQAYRETDGGTAD